MRLITILVVTYNQENVIRRTLDSILKQSQYGLKHIVVCDDCSTDNTWSILNEYKIKYPDIIQVYENEKNLGIYRNVEKCLSLRGEADLYLELAGDDALCDGLFDEVQGLLNREDVNTADAVELWFDWKIIYPNGQERIIKCDTIKSHNEPFGLWIRGKASRAIFLTESVLSRFKPVVTDEGLNLAEAMYDSQYYRFVDRIYYSPFVANIYYAGIGISTKISDNNSQYKTFETVKKIDYFIANYVSNERDRCWMLSTKYKALNKIQPSFLVFLKSVYFRMRGYASYNFSIVDLLRFIRDSFKCLV